MWKLFLLRASATIGLLAALTMIAPVAQAGEVCRVIEGVGVDRSQTRACEGANHDIHRQLARLRAASGFPWHITEWIGGHATRNPKHLWYCRKRVRICTPAPEI
jgi:hypothetical protein